MWLFFGLFIYDYAIKQRILRGFSNLTPAPIQR